MNFKEIKWIIPLTIGELLEKLPFENVTIPESNAVYIVTKNRWNDQPSISSEPLYAGSTTGISERFRTRLGGNIVYRKRGLQLEMQRFSLFQREKRFNLMRNHLLIERRISSPGRQ